MSSSKQPASSGRSGQSHQRTSSFPYPQRESSLQNDVTVSASKRPGLYARDAAAAQTTTSLSNLTKPPSRLAQDTTIRSQTPTQAARENPRLHQQGFFEPSLPTAANSSFSHTTGTSTLSQSQLAALAAMHVAPQHDRRRSQNGIEQPATAGAASAPRRAPNPPPIQTSQVSRPRLESAQGVRSESRSAAATAASAAFPRSPGDSPADTLREDYFMQSPASEREQRAGKEKTRRKLFSKPKNIHISKDKDTKGYATLPTPKTAGIYGSSGMVQQSQSTISLVDSIYSNPNASTTTLVPSDRAVGADKDKHRHNFLSRQKNKLKDEHHVALSSASSNSRPADPVQPQYLYNFAPSSPGVNAKSISGFDLRHGGRALREKKKEEKAAASIPPLPGSGASAETSHITDWPIPSTFSNNTPGGFSTQSPHQGASEYPFTTMTTGPDDPWPSLRMKLLQIFHRDSDDIRIPIEDLNRLVSLHLQHCIARKMPQTMIDDLNDLLRTGFHTIDISLRAIQDERLLVPHLVEIWSFVFSSVLPFLQAVFLPLDLELKGRGSLLSQRDAADFWASLPSSLRPTPDAAPVSTLTTTTATSTASGARPHSPPVPPMTDTRTLTLLQMRDTLILPRHETLLNIFSRLSLDSLIHTSAPNPFTTSLADMPPPPLPPGMHQRPGTAGSSSGNLDPSSFTSQTSTLDSTGGSSNSLGARSRATSNTSAGSYASVGSANAPGRFAPAPAPSSTANIGGIRAIGTATAAQQPPMDSAKITQTAAKMLQCLSVLASLRGLGFSSPSATTASQAPTTTTPIREIGNPLTSPIASPEQTRARSGTGGGFQVGEDDAEAVARRKMEQLSKELKLNWLGRGRTGRNRRGLVGGRRTPGVGVTA
ncbi:MAG: hypothetical protein M1828_007547 [Chrysothrix sp. TS-e1954]|nr:MAG: hypothetical protein M1828_007547 [Chrysothrix sp. TS-e1954]